MRRDNVQQRPSHDERGAQATRLEISSFGRGYTEQPRYSKVELCKPKHFPQARGGGGSLTTATEQELPSAIEPGVYCMLLRQAPVVAYEAYRSFSQKIDFG